MSACAAPLPLVTASEAPVPADAVMHGLPYMPLAVERLLQSKTWARCRIRPHMAFYLMNLWAAAWRGMPAASLEDDDDILAAAAQCPPEVWEDLRPELLRGWVRFDGRLYHPVQAEFARTAWDKRVTFRAKTRAARAAKAAKGGRRSVEGQSEMPLRAPRQTKPAEMSDQTAEIVGQSDSLTNCPKMSDETGDFVRHPECLTDRAILSDENADPVGQPRIPAESSVTELSQTFKDEGLSKKKGEEPPFTPRAKIERGSRLTEDWEPGADGYAYAINAGLDPDLTFERFRHEHLGRVGIAYRSPDWGMRWRAWCDKGRELQQRGRPKVSRLTKMHADFARANWARWTQEDNANEPTVSPWDGDCPPRATAA